MGKAHAIISRSVALSLLDPTLPKSIGETQQYQDLIMHLPKGTKVTGCHELVAYDLTVRHRIDLEHPMFKNDLPLHVNYYRAFYGVSENSDMRCEDLCLGLDVHSLHRVQGATDWCMECQKIYPLEISKKSRVILTKRYGV